MHACSAFTIIYLHVDGRTFSWPLAPPEQAHRIKQKPLKKNVDIVVSVAIHLTHALKQIL